MYKFPFHMFTDVRIEKTESTNYFIKNGEVEANNSTSIVGVIIRVFDGDMWYTSVTNNLDNIRLFRSPLSTRRYV